MAGEIGQPDGSDHEDDGHSGGDLGQKAAGSGRPEKSLARSSSESCANVCPLAGLEQDDQNQKDAYQNMDNRYGPRHMSKASSLNC